MEIKHLSFSTSGGAGRVATQLAYHQKLLGHKAEVISATDTTLFKKPYHAPLTASLAAADNFVIANASHASSISLLRNLTSRRLDVDRLVEKNLHFHWLPGLLNSWEIERIVNRAQKRILWTLHDMHPFTGGCHLAQGCEQFTKLCSSCPQVKGSFQFLVQKSHRQKLEIDFSSRDVVFIAPSAWMKDEAQSSNLLKNCRIELIENPVEGVYSNSVPKSEVRKLLSIPNNWLVSLVVAANLSDPNKQVQLFVNEFAKAVNFLNQNGLVILIGNNAEKISSPDINILRLGELSSSQIAEIMPAVDLLGLYSKTESASLVMAEAAVMGVPTVIRSENLGTKSLGLQLPSFFVANGIKDLSFVLESLISPEHVTRKQALSHKAKEMFDPSVVAKKYLDLHSEGE